MGISTEQWRAKIGTFSQPCKTKIYAETLKLFYNSFCIRIVLFYLLIAEGIEENPGPGSTGPGSTDRGRARGRKGNEFRGVARGSGLPKGRGSRDYFENVDSLSQLSQQVELRRSRQSRSRGQSSINNWLVSQAPAQSHENYNGTR